MTAAAEQLPGGPVGVVLLGNQRADGLARDLATRGWAVGELCGGRDRREVLTRLGQALGFPDYYGRNMDAAWDCLTDLAEPTVLVWRGWQDFAVAHPRDWAAILGLFHERCDLQPDFAVVLTR